jgi:hypothetical protein
VRAEMPRIRRRTRRVPGSQQNLPILFIRREWRPCFCRIPVALPVWIACIIAVVLRTRAVPGVAARH